jgi:hypothetical protein
VVKATATVRASMLKVPGRSRMVSPRATVRAGGLAIKPLHPGGLSLMAPHLALRDRGDIQVAAPGRASPAVVLPGRPCRQAVVPGRVCRWAVAARARGRFSCRGLALVRVRRQAAISARASRKTAARGRVSRRGLEPVRARRQAAVSAWVSRKTAARGRVSRPELEQGRARPRGRSVAAVSPRRARRRACQVLGLNSEQPAA